MKGKVFSVNISVAKGQPKDMVKSAVAKPGYGLEGDAHAGPGSRQVSLLAVEDIEKAEKSCSGGAMDFRPGIFAENITTEGVDFSAVRVGDCILVAETVVLRVSQIGKECHDGCEIQKKTGQCVMPKRGIFAVVERGGEIRPQDSVELPQERRPVSFWGKVLGKKNEDRY